MSWNDWITTRKPDYEFSFGYFLYISSNRQDDTVVKGDIAMRVELWKAAKKIPRHDGMRIERVTTEEHNESVVMSKKMQAVLKRGGLHIKAPYSSIHFTNPVEVELIFRCFYEYGWRPYAQVFSSPGDFNTCHIIEQMFDTKDEALESFNKMLLKLEKVNFHDHRGRMLVSDVLEKKRTIRFSEMNEGIFTLKVEEVKRVIRLICGLPSYTPLTGDRTALDGVELDFYSTKSEFVYGFHYAKQTWHLYVDRSTFGRPFYRLERIYPELTTPEYSNPVDVLLTNIFDSWNLHEYIDRQDLEKYMTGKLELDKLLYKVRGLKMTADLGLSENLCAHINEERISNESEYIDKRGYLKQKYWTPVRNYLQKKFPTYKIRLGQTMPKSMQYFDIVLSDADPITFDFTWSIRLEFLGGVRPAKDSTVRILHYEDEVSTPDVIGMIEIDNDPEKTAESIVKVLDKLRGTILSSELGIGQ